MSKVAQYLRGHIDGEVVTRLDVREALSYDNGILTERPEVVVYPRSTNDIRKIVRFAWQLAEKGHAVPVVPRGKGTDATAGAVGKGIMIDLSRYMDRVYEYDSKQHLVRLQPGSPVKQLQTALRLHGTAIAGLSFTDDGTVGGAVAVGSSGELSGKFGSVKKYVAQLEVVLDTGVILQTGRISKRELEKLKGMSGREGDIYRGIDGVLEEYSEVISAMKNDSALDRSGYPGIAEVQGKGGSFDLTPLFIGAQGTLGVIVEMIMKAEFMPKNIPRVAALFPTSEQALDAIDELVKLGPAALDYYDGSYLKTAIAEWRKISWISTDTKQFGASIELSFHELSHHKQKALLKKAAKILSRYECQSVTTNDESREQLLAAREAVEMVGLPPHQADRRAPLLGTGFYVNPGRFEDFMKELLTLGEKLHLELPVYGSALASIYYIRPTVSLHKTADKQKIIKLLDQLNSIVNAYGGTLVGDGAEGRLLSRFARASWGDEYASMMDAIKNVFDPRGILNPRAKAKTELRELVSMLRSDSTPRL